MATPATPTDAPTRDAVRLTLLALVAAIAFAYIHTDGPDRYRMVDELGDMADLEGRPLMVHGWVLPGSQHETVIDQQPARTFVLHKGGRKLTVVYRGALPDTFRDQSEVVVRGTLVPVESTSAVGTFEGTHVLESNELRGRCSTRYESAAALLRYE